MEPLNLPTYFFRLKDDGGKKYIFDEIRRRFVILTPEEWVRQHMVNYLINVKNYPRSLISVEKGFNQNRNRRRYDLLIYNKSGSPVMIVECKAPGMEINQHVFDQAGRYNNRYKAEYMLITNGIKHYCCLIQINSKSYSFLKDIPEFSELAQCKLAE
jgi:hypothetical protein